MPRTTDRASELHRWSEKQAAHQQRECAPRRLSAPQKRCYYTWDNYSLPATVTDNQEDMF